MLMMVLPRTTVNRETTGTLLINEACLGDSRRCSFIHFNALLHKSLSY